MASGECLPRRFVRVVDVSLPTPRTVRVVARGELADWPEPGPASQLELFLPDTPVGPVSRTYTVRDWDRDRGDVTVDMCLNAGHGPATQWASRVVPGMWLEISGSAPSTFEPSPEAGSYLFAGDATALPAISTCLASLSLGSVATAILAVEDEQEHQAFETRASVDVRWLHASTDAADLAAAVLGALSESTPGAVWVACEEQVMYAVRGGLLARGYPAAQLSAHAYWQRPDRTR